MIDYYIKQKNYLIQTSHLLAKMTYKRLVSYILIVLVTMAAFYDEAYGISKEKQGLNNSHMRRKIDTNQHINTYEDNDFFEHFEQLFREMDLWLHNRRNFYYFSHYLDNSFNIINYYTEANDRQYIYYVEVPGYDKEEIKIELQGEYLVLKGQHLDKEKSRSFYQKLFLPKDINKDSISSTLKNGMLSIFLERVQLKKEDIKAIPIV